MAAVEWLAPLLQREEAERSWRSMERHLASAHIRCFRHLADFDWNWPSRSDRVTVESLMVSEFIAEAANVVLVSPYGVGKSMLARKIAHKVLIHGHTVRVATAGDLLGELAALDSDTALRRYSSPVCWKTTKSASLHGIRLGKCRLRTAQNAGKNHSKKFSGFFLSNLFAQGANCLTFVNI